MRSRRSTIPFQGGPIRTIIVSLIGAVALATGLIVIRQQRNVTLPQASEVPPGESVPGEISLERLRGAGY